MGANMGGGGGQERNCMFGNLMGNNMNMMGNMNNMNMMNNLGINSMGGVNNMGMNNMGMNNMGMANNFGQNQNNINSMQNMLLMNQLSNNKELGDVGTIFNNQIRQQQMQQVQQYADQNQAAMCMQVPAHDRNAAQRDHTGNMMRDMAMCQAKQGCFDAIMWDYVDQK